MFETFNAPALYVAIQAVLSLYAAGRTTGGSNKTTSLTTGADVTTFRAVSKVEQLFCFIINLTDEVRRSC